MEFTQEVQRMADNANASNAVASAGDGPLQEDVQLWQRLFQYSPSEAVDRLIQHRADLNRNRISDAAWDDMKAHQVKAGFDKEAYEHSISRAVITASSKPEPSSPSSSHGERSSSSQTYLVKMEGPLAQTPTAIQDILGPSSSPLEIRMGQAEDGEEARFCRITAAGRVAIQAWLSSNYAQRPAFRPTFIPESSMARKDLCPRSRHPTLGIDATLPQHRFDSVLDQEGVPQRNDGYPVWYFFYGTLGTPDVLARQLGMEEGEVARTLSPAAVKGGVVKTWGGKYKALVDGAEKEMVAGWAFEVLCAEQEEALRTYETARYEVVRCRIEFLVGEYAVDGLTFRFVDPTLLS